MPMTPAAAFQKSPKCRLTDEQREAMATITAKMDAYLATEWDGGPFIQRTDYLPTATLTQIIRSYELHGWTVQATPLDGVLGKAQEILQHGGSPQWILHLTPRWFSSL